MRIKLTNSLRVFIFLIITLFFYINSNAANTQLYCLSNNIDRHVSLMQSDVYSSYISPSINFIELEKSTSIDHIAEIELLDSTNITSSLIVKQDLISLNSSLGSKIYFSRVSIPQRKGYVKPFVESYPLNPSLNYALEQYNITPKLIVANQNLPLVLIPVTDQEHPSKYLFKVFIYSIDSEGNIFAKTSDIIIENADRTLFNPEFSEDNKWIKFNKYDLNTKKFSIVLYQVENKRLINLDIKSNSIINSKLAGKAIFWVEKQLDNSSNKNSNKIIWNVWESDIEQLGGGHPNLVLSEPMQSNYLVFGINKIQVNPEEYHPLSESNEYQIATVAEKDFQLNIYNYNKADHTTRLNKFDFSPVFKFIATQAHKLNMPLISSLNYDFTNSKWLLGVNLEKGIASFSDLNSTWQLHATNGSIISKIKQCSQYTFKEQRK